MFLSHEENTQMTRERMNKLGDDGPALGIVLLMVMMVQPTHLSVTSRDQIISPESRAMIQGGVWLDIILLVSVSPLPPSTCLSRCVYISQLSLKLCFCVSAKLWAECSVTVWLPPGFVKGQLFSNPEIKSSRTFPTREPILTLRSSFPLRFQPLLL